MPEVCFPQGVDVVIELARQHSGQLARIEERLDILGWRFDHVDRRFRAVDDQLDRGFDRLDERLAHVEQRLDFVSGQLTQLLRRPAS